MILFLDDEEQRMKPYVEMCIFEGLDVKPIFDPEQAWRLLEENAGEVELLILDVMMPSGDRFDRPRALDGIRTGVVFLEEMRKKWVSLPVLLFTSSNDKHLDAIAQQYPRTYLERKQAVLPDQLPNLIKSIIR